MDDLELKELDMYHGTEKYHDVMGGNVTDGVAYIMNNGYSWFVTDSLAVIRIQLKKEPFLSVKLKLKDDTADMIITDGNDKVLYKQHYGYTSAKRELNLYYSNNVLMLSGEY